MRTWILGLAASAGCVVGGGEMEFAFDDVSALVVTVGSGEVTVRPSDDGGSRLAWEGGGFGRAAQPEIFQDASGAVFVDAKGGLGGTELDVALAQGVPVDVLWHRGEIDLTFDVPADVEACVAAGEVSIGLPAGRYVLDLEAAVGTISSEIVHDPDAETSIHACAAAGEVEVFLVDPQDDRP